MLGECVIGFSRHITLTTLLLWTPIYNYFLSGLSITPLNPARFQGSSITFSCIAVGPVGSIQWFINGTLLQDPPMNNNITITRISDTLSVLVISSVSDDITAQCTSTNPSAQSDISTLSVQGMLVL